MRLEEVFHRRTMPVVATLLTTLLLHNGAFATPICRTWTNMSNHRAIIQAFYEEIWNKHDQSQIPALLHEDFGLLESASTTRRSPEHSAMFGIGC